MPDPSSPRRTTRQPAIAPASLSVRDLDRRRRIGLSGFRAIARRSVRCAARVPGSLQAILKEGRNHVEARVSVLASSSGGRVVGFGTLIVSVVHAPFSIPALVMTLGVGTRDRDDVVSDGSSSDVS